MEFWSVWSFGIGAQGEGRVHFFKAEVRNPYCPGLKRALCRAPFALSCQFAGSRTDRSNGSYYP